MLATTVVAADAAGAAEMVDAVNVTSAAHTIAMTRTIREGSRAIIELIPSRDSRPRLHGPPRAPPSLATVTKSRDQSWTVAGIAPEGRSGQDVTSPEAPHREGVQTEFGAHSTRQRGEFANRHDRDDGT